MKPSVFELAEIYKEDRPMMDAHNKDLSRLMPLLSDEWRELLEAVHDLNKGIGTAEEVMAEAADIFLLLVALGRALGEPLQAAALTKIARNMAKYPAHRFLNGDRYEDVMPELKAEWEQIEGDRDFYGK